jgi:serine/threonine protein kinase
VPEDFDIAKLCDFGLSGRLDSDGKINMTRVGTMGYMAPELGKGPVDSSIDMFSFGVVLYEMTTAYKPTAVKNFKYGSGPIPFRNVDWRKRNRNL